MRGSAVLLLMLGLPAWAAGDLAYVHDAAPAADQVIIDVRPLARCEQASLPGARCLPADALLGPNRSLPASADLLWLLGTLGLDGSETVLVVGDEALARDFVAGLLHLAGQRAVRILDQPVAHALAAANGGDAGRGRSRAREAVFQAPMRDGQLLLREELEHWLEAPSDTAASVTLLDGRTTEEYWGERTRSLRGGHLPGAVSLPAAWLRGALEADAPRPALPDGAVIAYAHDALEGLAYATRLQAGFGVPARLYAAGWAEWGATTRLPVDSESWPERRAPAAQKSQPSQDGARAALWRERALWLAALLLALLLAFSAGRHWRGRAGAP